MSADTNGTAKGAPTGAPAAAPSWRLNHCRDSGASVGGRRQGGARWTSYATCPTCGKRIAITQAGRLRAHGTRVAVQPAHPLLDEDASDYGRPETGAW